MWISDETIKDYSNGRGRGEEGEEKRGERVSEGSRVDDAAKRYVKLTDHTLDSQRGLGSSRHLHELFRLLWIFLHKQLR